MIHIAKESVSLNSLIFGSIPHYLELNSDIALKKVKIIAKETALKLGSATEVLKIQSFKCQDFKFLSQVIRCSLSLVSVNVFGVPECGLLRRLELKGLNPGTIRLVKLITQKAKCLEEVKLEEMEDKAHDIEIASDSLKSIELVKMENLPVIKVKGKAKPMKMGFKRTKLVHEKK